MSERRERRERKEARWLDAGGPPGAVELLRSHAPLLELSDDARRRVFARIGSPGVVSAAAVPSATFGSVVRHAAFAKGASVLALSGALLSIERPRVAESRPPAPATVPGFPAAPPTFPAERASFPATPQVFPAKAEAFPASPGVFPAKALFVPAKPEAFPAPEQGAAAGFGESGGAAKDPSAESQTDSLAAELALLDRARRSREGEPMAALLALDEHERKFERGMLRDERDVMRLEVLEKMGRHEEAKRGARAFLARTGTGLYASRVSAMLAQ